MIDSGFSAKPAWRCRSSKDERVLVDQLVPYAQNARTHSEAQVLQIAESIKQWGWTSPILIDENGGLIAGHGRILAAKLLALVDVPAMRAIGWTPAQKRAYILADNKLALNAGWDEELLAAELCDLQVDGFDLATIGFSEIELGDLLAAKPEPEPVVELTKDQDALVALAVAEKLAAEWEHDFVKRSQPSAAGYRRAYTKATMAGSLSSSEIHAGAEFPRNATYAAIARTALQVPGQRMNSLSPSCSPAPDRQRGSHSMRWRCT